MEFQQAVEAVEPRPREPRLAAVSGRAETLGGEALFRAPGARLHLLPLAALQVLDLCRPFRTVAEHVAALQQALPGLSGEGARQALQALRERGLLIDDTAWLRALTRAPARVPAPIGPVFIRACDRPVQLEALLVSLAANEGQHGAGHRYIVLDDSRDPANVAANRAALVEFARSAGVRAHHLDGAAWAAIERRLGIGDDTRQAAAFLLGGSTFTPVRAGGGRGYNLAALLGAGSRYVLLDEDFLLPLRALRDRDRTLSTAAHAPLSAGFHPDVATALAAGEALVREPVAYAAAICGHGLAELLANGSLVLPADALDGFAPSLAPHWQAGTGIATVAFGHRGAAGTQSSRWMFLLDPAARTALWRDEHSYRAALRGEAIWYAPPQALLLPQVAFTPFMVDAGTWVAPTLPRGRGEDLLFAALRAATEPASAAWHSSFTVGHRQEPGRDRIAELQQPVAPVLNQFLAESVASWSDELAAATPAARLAAIAARFEDLAESSSVLLDRVDGHVRHVRADLVQRLREAALGAGAAPPWWRRDVETLIAVNRTALTAAAPLGFADFAPESDAPGALQAELQGFAAALRAWPALCARAGEIGCDALIS